MLIVPASAEELPAESGAVDATAPTTPSNPIAGTRNCLRWYPDEAKRLKHAGIVFVNYDVAADGSIENVVLPKSSGFRELDIAAYACVTRQWRNTPAMNGAVPVESKGHKAFIVFMSEDMSAEDYYRFGIVMAYVHDDKGAIFYLSKAIAVRPGFTEAYFRRGLLYDRTGDHAHALEDYASAGRSPPP